MGRAEPSGSAVAAESRSGLAVTRGTEPRSPRLPSKDTELQRCPSPARMGGTGDRETSALTQSIPDLGAAKDAHGCRFLFAWPFTQSLALLRNRRDL